MYQVNCHLTWIFFSRTKTPRKYLNVTILLYMTLTSYIPWFFLLLTMFSHSWVPIKRRTVSHRESNHGKNHFVNGRLRIHLLVELFRRIMISLRFHRLLICKFQWRSIRLTNPWVVEYSLTTRHSSTLPSWLGLADLENFHKNHIGLGTLCGNERSLLCSHLFPTTGEHFSFYNFKMISQNESFKSLVCGLWR